MLQKGICVLTLAIVLTTAAWSEETTPAPQGIKKQRVSPKLLREAMALPEYKAPVHPASSPPSVEHLQRLSEKLKTGGDKEGSELLQRFIQEHQRLVKQSSSKAESFGEMLNIRLEVMEVKMEFLTRDSILLNDRIGSELSASETAEIRKEVDRLVAAKKARTLIDGMTISTRINEEASMSYGSEFLLRQSDKKNVTSEFPEYGIAIDVLPTSLTQDRVSLQLKCEFLENDLDNAITVDGTTIPGVSKQKMQCVIPSNFGETAVLSCVRAAGSNPRQLLVLTKVTLKKPK